MNAVPIAIETPKMTNPTGTLFACTQMQWLWLLDCAEWGPVLIATQRDREPIAVGMVVPAPFLIQ